LLAALLIFHVLPRGFANRDLREHIAHLLGLSPGQFTQGRMTYDLRRLRLHGLIERTPNSHRYRVTAFGFRSAMFLRRAYNRLFRTGLSVLAGPDPPQPASLRRAVHHVEQAVDRLWLDAA
jgi:predicted MarR family transcription regulator